MRLKKIVVLVGIVLFLHTLNVGGYITFASTDVEVQIVNFEVEINDVNIENATAAYPMILYKDITYFPMSWDFTQSLGLRTKFSEEKGLQITKTGVTKPLNQNATAENDLEIAYTATLPEFPIEINGRPIDNAQQEYPLLLFRGVTYFPLTWEYAYDEFGWAEPWFSQNKLTINTQRYAEIPDDFYKNFVQYEGLTDEQNAENVRVSFLNFDGEGQFFFEEGTIYTGHFENGEFSGQGKMTWSDDEWYEGEFREGLRHGYGEYHYPDGTVYKGNWQEGEITE